MDVTNNLVGTGTSPMTMQVNAGAPTRRRVRTWKVASHAWPAAPVHRPAPSQRPAAVQNPQLFQLPQAAPAPVSAAAPAPAPAPAPEKIEPVGDVDYDAFDASDFTGGIAGSVVGDIAGPPIADLIGKQLSAEKFPWLATPYGKVVAGKVTGLAIGQIAGASGGVVTNLMRHALHGIAPKLVGEADPGLGISVPPANVLAAGLVKGIATGWANVWLKQQFTPPPPPPPPPAAGPPPAAAPGASPDTAPVAEAKHAASILGHPVSELANDAAMGAMSMVIGAAYDQTLGPIVKRTINTVMGKGDEKVAPAKPLTPGGVASALIGGMVNTVLMRPVEFTPVGGAIDAAAGAGGLLAGIGTSLTNALIGSAIDSVYSRGIGPAIEDTINGVAGIAPAERTPQVPALERFMRTAGRSVASAAAYHLVDQATQGVFIQMGAALGGTWGALLAMAGPALLGMATGTAIDQVIGAKLGEFGGKVYSWITGKPNYEQRAAEEAAKPKPGPTPGSPVDAPNGNSGTVPAPEGDAPAAPAGGEAGATAETDEERKRAAALHLAQLATAAA